MPPYTFDLQRIFFGDLPLLFLVEIVFRTLVMFGYTLLILRFFSGRGAGVGELSLFELVLIVLLGSAVGDPMFYPDVPLFHGIVVITVIVFMQRGMILLTNRFRSVEKVLEGLPICLVIDGAINVDGMHKARLSFAEVQMELRHKNIENLGQVRRAFLETDGMTSVFKNQEAALGLDILPDAYTLEDDRKMGTSLQQEMALACKQCGNVQTFPDHETITPCPKCKGEVWVAARTSRA